MTSSWRCYACNLSGEGTWAECDRSAEKHTKETKHATVTRTVGSRRERDAGGRVVNRKTRSEGHA